MSLTWNEAVGVVALVAIAVTALSFAGVAHRRAVMTASIRATIQLAIVALALRGVFSAPATAFAVVAVMFAVATWTAARRMGAGTEMLVSVAIAICAGAAVSIAVIVGLPTLTRDTRTLVAVSGIVIGGSMTAATLTGRRIASGLQTRRDEVEAWLALGATPRVAVLPIARQAVYEALVPALDQTRTVGLVTLPGAFAGALVGGAGVSEAAQFQVVVLVGLLAAEAVTAVTLAYRLGAPTTLPVAPEGAHAE